MIVGVIAVSVEVVATLATVAAVTHSQNVNQKVKSLLTAKLQTLAHLPIF